MRNLFTLIMLIGMSIGMHSVWGQCSDLYFSEYIEGSSSNKALEIYNPTGATISLSDYVLYRANNGAVTANDSLFPVGDIAPYDVFVIANASANAAILAESDTTHSLTFYNGDDAVMLIKISTGDTLDLIGVLGIDPGAGWPVGSGATNNNTLVRSGLVGGGTTDWALSSMQWDVYGIDTFGFIGSHGSICDPTYVPVYPIGLITTDNDGDGIADSVGVSGEFRGVVHGIDLQGGSSIQFTLIDGTGGIGVFSSNDYGYTVQEGDSLHVPGSISNFNGLAQINPDTIEVISTGNSLKTATEITSLDESTESEMIQFRKAYLVNPADWPTSTGSKNFDITNGTDTITIRVDSDTDIDGTVGPPVDTFKVTGIGGQFDNNNPPTGGYQLLPRYLTDFEVDTTVVFVSGLPIYPIDLVTSDNDSDGIADSLGVACELTGIVHGIDMQGSPSLISFTIIDGTGGIVVFNNGNAFGYTVQEGDSVVVPGTINNFNGLAQITPDTIVLGSSGNPTVTPAVITSLGEVTESELIKFENAYLADPSQWNTGGGSFNFDVTNGTDTINCRIDSDTDIAGTPAPVDTFDIVGLGGQFDTNTPPIDGYQLLPRYMPDIILDTTGFMGLPIYPIDLVTNDSDGDGVADSAGVACELRGVVYGIDIQGNSNIGFTLIDATGGIAAFEFNEFGYTVQEGDSLHLPGMISNFNGLAQIRLDTILFISSGNALVSPAIITTLDESTESELIQFNNAYLVDPAQWMTTGGSFNFDVTNGPDTIAVRIDSDTDIFGTPAPVGFFNLTGLGGQFDNSPPYNDGYQLLPRYMPDIDILPAPGYSFSPANIIASETGGSVSFDIGLSMALLDTSTVDVSLSMSSTATDGADFDSWMDTTITIPAGELGPVNLSLNILDDAILDADETIVLELSNPTGDAILGDSVLTIMIEDDELPQYPIGLLTTDNDMNGVGDSLGVSCIIQGIVYGIDIQGGGSIQFTIIDSTGGIALFGFNEFGYTVQEGDEVQVPGTISVFNGLTQITPDTIVVISTGNSIDPPTVVTMLDETTESELIALECVRLVDPSAWPSMGGGSVNLEVTNDVDTFSVRIDSDVDLYNTPTPTQKWLNIAGLGGQFDGSTPPLSGYQLLPRYIADVVERPNPTVSFEVAADTVAETGANIDITVTQTDGNPDSTSFVVELDAMASTATNGDDFTYVPASVKLAGCGTSSLIVSLSIVDDMDAEGDETIVLYINELDNGAVVGIDTVVITISDDDAAGLNELALSAIKMYPNPTDAQVQLQSDYRMEQISVRNLLGQEVLGRSNMGLTANLTVSKLPQGVYLVLIETAEGIWRQKLVIE